MKKILHKVHLYLGLAIGCIFFIIAFSGAIYTWEPEIATIIYKQKVKPKNTSFVKVSTLKANMVKELPNGDFRGVLFQGRAKTANVLLYVPGTYYYAYMDPYSGQLIHLQDMKKGWLNILKMLHRNLLLGDVGKQIVHWVTLLALIMVLSGIVLWWPNKKFKRKNHFTIKWASRSVKLNYDLHNVLGFYASWIGVLVILTGVFWGFKSFRNVIKSTVTKKEIAYALPKSDTTVNFGTHNIQIMVDSLANNFLSNKPDTFMRISFPHKATDPIVMTMPDVLNRVHRTNNYYFDQYTGKLIQGKFENGLYNESSAFKTINGLTYDIHLGNLGGFFGRLIVCLTSLVMASLPITGFIIWFSKR
ncbi:PepSY-associated TM helix domain-containing protein [Aurantibacter sp.]|uniref:PepSY-associated TM helix domain-containing protein n=1 Tax=Aurantibacter sp. TaxID=2807103 RepID=UPI003263DC4C